MNMKTVSWQKKEIKKIFFFLLVGIFNFWGIKLEAVLPPLKVYTLSDQTFVSKGGEITASLTVKPQKGAQNLRCLIKGVYKKVSQKSSQKADRSEKERFLITWQNVILRRGKISPKKVVVKEIYSDVESSFMKAGTRLTIKGNCRALLFKIQETLKKERALRSRPSSLSDKKRGSFSERASVLEKNLSKESFSPRERKRLGQEFQNLASYPKRHKKEKNAEEQGRENSQMFVPETMEVEILKEGCFPRIDKIQESAIVQTRSIIRKNGKIYKEEACSDSSERYPLKKRYEGCQDQILKEERRVHPQYKWYWVDDKGHIHDVDDVCKPDEDITFEILEEEEPCDLDVNLTQMTARQMAELSYKDYRKRRILIEACRPHSQKENLLLEKIFCGYHHNFELGVSTPQTRIITFIKGHERRVTPCSDDGEPLVHQLSTMGCEAIIDSVSRRKFSQSRVVIESPEGPLFLTRCRPSQELEETWEGCSHKFDHDLEIEQSRGYSRFFYKKGPHVVFVTECEPSEQVFLHQVRHVGFVHDDEAKSSKSQTEIYIDVPYVGNVLVDAAKVRNNSPVIAYKVENIQDRLDLENAVYEGCFKITPQIQNS
ncbi:MAG: hypothetical protein B7Y25_01295 [Alphaproteobacteria bacterium 16-39-46]|nr:MAG: hypothetical protein B7Y25_01295 [Alphaproteobacteria bacterium 16-39-46]OZA44123.1 MAG: hypothetical protein B7X84_01185 [Alphaproteobacteria bacterium 17-39-52]HQS83533.1 hypothetical protein [Alphaproteobacteria bacterium]HQS93301.1 hypothetical protein [Alphaproteobacteria bacterium]